jgi:hypothetical protein
MLFQDGYEDGFSGLKRNNIYKSPLYDSGYDLGREDKLHYETEVFESSTESNWTRSQSQ